MGAIDEPSEGKLISPLIRKGCRDVTGLVTKPMLDPRSGR
jgi:hypothetical protein